MTITGKLEKPQPVPRPNRDAREEFALQYILPRLAPCYTATSMKEGCVRVGFGANQAALICADRGASRNKTLERLVQHVEYNAQDPLHSVVTFWMPGGRGETASLPLMAFVFLEQEGVQYTALPNFVRSRADNEAMIAHKDRRAADPESYKPNYLFKPVRTEDLAVRVDCIRHD